MNLSCRTEHLSAECSNGLVLSLTCYRDAHLSFRHFSSPRNNVSPIFLLHTLKNTFLDFSWKKMQISQISSFAWPRFVASTVQVGNYLQLIKMQRFFKIFFDGLFCDKTQKIVIFGGFPKKTSFEEIFFGFCGKQELGVKWHEQAMGSQILIYCPFKIFVIHFWPVEFENKNFLKVFLKMSFSGNLFHSNVKNTVIFDQVAVKLTQCALLKNSLIIKHTMPHL